MNELALFAGAGGGILGGKMLGWKTVCAVEHDAFAASVLIQRQNDLLLDPFPIWSDIASFDGTKWRGHVDVVSGGFPCQDISVAGHGRGIKGERSGLWSEMDRIICEVRPRIVFIENVTALLIRGFERVLSDLHESGYDVEWSCLSASGVGAIHQRERVWILAADHKRERSKGNSTSEVRGITRMERLKDVRRVEDLRGRSDIPEPLICGTGYGIPYWMDRLKTIGNAQVPHCAAAAFTQLKERIDHVRD